MLASHFQINCKKQIKVNWRAVQIIQTRKNVAAKEKVYYTSKMLKFCINKGFRYLKST